MTTRSDFSNDEWAALVYLPRWVVAAASASQLDRPNRTKVEVEAGLIASAQGRDSGNAFVAEVGADTLRVFDDPGAVSAIEFADTESGIQTVLAQVEVVNRVLAERAAIPDAMAYRRWLLAITDVVIAAARSNDFLGFGGQLITESEQRFRDRLALVFQR